MKQILIKTIFFSFFFFFVFPPVFAENIDVSVSSQDIMMGEALEMTVEISGVEGGNFSGDIRVVGIENFQIFSQRSGYSFRNINGNVQNISNITLSLRPLQTGDFSLGPVSIETQNGVIENEEVFTIQVRELGASFSESDGEKNLQTDQKSQENSSLSDIQKQQDNIRGLREIKISSLGILFFLGAFLGFFSLVLHFFLSKNNKTISEKKNISQKTKNDTSEKNKMIGAFKKLKKDAQDMSSIEFFKNFNTAVRELFVLLGYQEFQKMSMQELENNLQAKNLSFLDVYKKTYYGEYKQGSISREKRQEYISEILDFLAHRK